MGFVFSVMVCTAMPVMQDAQWVPRDSCIIAHSDPDHPFATARECREAMVLFYESLPPNFRKAIGGCFKQ